MKNLTPSLAHEIDLRIKKVNFKEKLDENELRKKELKKWLEESSNFLDFKELAELTRELDGKTWGGSIPRFNLKELWKIESDLENEKKILEKNLLVREELTDEKNSLIEYAKEWLTIKDDLKKTILKISVFDDEKKKYVLGNCDVYDDEIKSLKKESFSRERFLNVEDVASEDENSGECGDSLRYFFEKPDMSFWILGKAGNEFSIEIPCASKEMTHHFIGLPEDCEATAVVKNGELFISLKGRLSLNMFANPIVALNEIEKITIRFIATENPLETKIRTNNEEKCENLEKASKFSFKEFGGNADFFKKRLINSLFYSFKKNKENVTVEEAAEMLKEIEHRLNVLINERKDDFFARNFINLKIFSRERGVKLANEISGLMRKNCALRLNEKRLKNEIENLIILKEKLEYLLNSIYDRLHELKDKDLKGKIEELFMINLRREALTKKITFFLIRTSMKLWEDKVERRNKNSMEAATLGRDILNGINYFFSDLNYEKISEVLENEVVKNFFKVNDDIIKKINSCETEWAYISSFFRLYGNAWGRDLWTIRFETKQKMEKLTSDLEMTNNRLNGSYSPNEFSKEYDIFQKGFLFIIEMMTAYRDFISRIIEKLSRGENYGHQNFRNENPMDNELGRDPRMNLLRNNVYFWRTFFHLKYASLPFYENNMSSSIKALIDDEKEMVVLWTKLKRCMLFKEEIEKLKSAIDKIEDKEKEINEFLISVENLWFWINDFSWKLEKKKKIADSFFDFSFRKTEEIIDAIDVANENKLKKLFADKKNLYVLFRIKMDSLPFAYPEEDVKKLEETEEKTSEADEEVIAKIGDVRAELSKTATREWKRKSQKFLELLEKFISATEKIRNNDPQNIKDVKKALTDAKKSSNWIFSWFWLNRDFAPSENFYDEYIDNRKKTIDLLTKIRNLDLTCAAKKEEMETLGRKFEEIASIALTIHQTIWEYLINNENSHSISQKIAFLSARRQTLENAIGEAQEFIPQATNLSNKILLDLGKISAILNAQENKKTIEELKKAIAKDALVSEITIMNFIQSVVSMFMFLSRWHVSILTTNASIFANRVEKLKKTFESARKKVLERCNMDFEIFWSINEEMREKFNRYKNGISEDDVKKNMKASERSDEARRKIILFLNPTKTFRNYEDETKKFEEIEKNINSKIESFFRKMEEKGIELKKDRLGKILLAENLWLKSQKNVCDSFYAAAVLLNNLGEKIPVLSNEAQFLSDEMRNIFNAGRLIKNASGSIQETKDVTIMACDLGLEMVEKIASMRNSWDYSFHQKLMVSSSIINDGINDLRTFLSNLSSSNAEFQRLKTTKSSIVWNLVMIRAALASDAPIIRNFNDDSLNAWHNSYATALNGIRYSLSSSLSNFNSSLKHNFIFYSASKANFSQAMRDYPNLQEKFNGISERIIFNEDLRTYENSVRSLTFVLTQSTNAKIRMAKNSILDPFFSKRLEIENKIQKIRATVDSLSNLKNKIKDETLNEKWRKKIDDFENLIEKMKNIDSLQEIKKSTKFHETCRKILALMKRKILLRESIDEILEFAIVMKKEIDKFLTENERNEINLTNDAIDFLKKAELFFKKDEERFWIEELIEEESDDHYGIFEEKIKEKMKTFDMVEVEEVERWNELANAKWKRILGNALSCDIELNSNQTEEIENKIRKFATDDYGRLKTKLENKKMIYDQRNIGEYFDIGTFIKLGNIDPILNRFYLLPVFYEIGLTREWHQQTMNKLNSFFSESSRIANFYSNLINNDDNLGVHITMFEQTLNAYIAMIFMCINQMRSNPMMAQSIFATYDPVFVGYEMALQHESTQMRIDDYIISDDLPDNLIQSFIQINDDCMHAVDASQKIQEFQNFMVQSGAFVALDNFPVEAARADVNETKRLLENFNEDMTDFSIETEILESFEFSINYIKSHAYLMLKTLFEKVKDKITIDEIVETTKIEKRCETELKQLTNKLRNDFSIQTTIE